MQNEPGWEYVVLIWLILLLVVILVSGFGLLLAYGG